MCVDKTCKIENGQRKYCEKGKLQVQKEKSFNTFMHVQVHYILVDRQLCQSRTSHWRMREKERVSEELWPETRCVQVCVCAFFPFLSLRRRRRMFPLFFEHRNLSSSLFTEMEVYGLAICFYSKCGEYENDDQQLRWRRWLCADYHTPQATTIVDQLVYFSFSSFVVIFSLCRRRSAVRPLQASTDEEWTTVW